MRKARGRTSEQTLGKVAFTDESGRPRIVDQPPIMQHVGVEAVDRTRTILRSYATTVRADIALLLTQFTVEDAALRIVGVGSVGTRCHIVLLVGPSGEALFLQSKETAPSVVTTYGGVPTSMTPVGIGLLNQGDGARVVSCQRILQAASDPFLGHVTVQGRDLFVRQFRDMKGSIDVETLTHDQFDGYAALCGAVLARAHAQSGHSAFVAGYLGSSDAYDQAIGAWALAYADQVEADYRALQSAAEAGRVPVIPGV